MLSVVIVRMDYPQLADNLSKATDDEGDITTAWELSKIDMAYRDAANQAGRKRDQVTLDLTASWCLRCTPGRTDWNWRL
jgi:thiol:disulfide interchange protein